MSIPRKSLRTERLVLRPTLATDADRAFEIQSDWNVARMLRMASFPPDREEMRQWFRDQPREWLVGEAYRFAVERDGRMIGIVDIDEVADRKGSLGYWFERGSWGQGYAFEAAQALTRFASEEIEFEGLVSAHASDNAASGRVFAKLGFSRLDTVRRFSRSRGEMIDQHRYALRFDTDRDAG